MYAVLTGACDAQYHRSLRNVFFLSDRVLSIILKTLISSHMWNQSSSIQHENFITSWKTLTTSVNLSFLSLYISHTCSMLGSWTIKGCLTETPLVQFSHISETTNTQTSGTDQKQSSPFRLT